MTTGFRINGTDTDDLFVRKDLFTEGGLWLWGDNVVGQLGDNTRTNRSSPVQTIAGGTNWKQIAIGSAQVTAAIKTDGTLWLWGSNNLGQLGDNTTTNKSSPVQTVSGGTNWKQISTGTLYVATIKTDGTLWSWGSNGRGQLGTNDITHRSSPVQTIAGGTNWKQVSCASGHSAAIKTDGTLWTWGFNGDGQLGDNTRTDKSSPVQTIAGGTNWKQVSCGGSNSAAIKTDGTLWLWGDNFYGQLGDNTRTDKSSPVQTIAGGTNWKQVNVAAGNSAAIKTDGTLWAWGYNLYGQLGDNTITSKSSPVQTVSGGTNWKQVITSGSSFTAAIKTDGTLWAWGYNISGQLGTNDRTDRSSPVQTVSGGTNWNVLGLGDSTIAAIRGDYWA